MSGPPPYDPRDLTSEKDLWSVFLLSRKIKPSKISFFVTLLVASALFVTAFHFSVPTGLILRDTRKWAEVGLSYAITTLGFLIAGYTVFATVADPKMMLKMMEHTDSETGLPTLKVNHIKLVKVLMDYILWIFVYILVLLFGQSQGLVSHLVSSLPNGDCIKDVLSRVAYVTIGASFAYLLMMLQAFVFNIYAIVMNMLRWEWHNTHGQVNTGRDGR
jgi:hypothetical protein